MAINIKQLQNSLDEMKGLIERQGAAIKILGEQEALNKEIIHLKEQSGKKEFCVLIMGTFNSGKSSAINVLLSEKILPTKPLPSTAIITEIRYGEKKKVIMYPKPGKWAGGNAPFEIPPEKMAEYAVIENPTGEIANDRTKMKNKLDGTIADDIQLLSDEINGIETERQKHKEKVVEYTNNLNNSKNELADIDSKVDEICRQYHIVLKTE